MVGQRHVMDRIGAQYENAVQSQACRDYVTRLLALPN